MDPVQATFNLVCFVEALFALAFIGVLISKLRK
jgi:hypothetical protein